MFTVFIKDVKAQKLEKINILTVLKALLFNQAVQLLVLYRLSRRVRSIWFFGPTLSSSLSYIIQVLTSCHINPGSIIMPGVYFPHPTGIVIGEGVVIEGKATIYQNVTVGQRNSYDKRYPVICTGAVIYTGAVVLGEITIAKNAIIGANSVVNKSVCAGRIVGGIPAVDLSQYE